MCPFFYLFLSFPIAVSIPIFNLVLSGKFLFPSLPQFSVFGIFFRPLPYRWPKSILFPVSVVGLRALLLLSKLCFFSDLLHRLLLQFSKICMHLFRTLPPLFTSFTFLVSVPNLMYKFYGGKFCERTVKGPPLKYHHRVLKRRNFSPTRLRRFSFPKNKK